VTTDAEVRREKVLAALVSAGGARVSGQALAQELGCSRAAIHRHVETLRRAGIGIDGVHEGYRLSPMSDPIAPSLVQAALDPPIAGPVRWTTTTGSTNDDAVAAARSGAPEGLVIGTDFQEAGRGRRGRPWITLPGDALLFSILLRPRVPAADAGVLPIVAAVAVADAVGDSARIVWPNDILVDERKVCGVLCEMAADESGTAWVVVGVGANVRGAPDLDDPRWEAGSLADAGDSRRRGEALVAMLRSLASRYAEWRDEGPGATLAAFAERDLLRGRGVTVRAGDRETVGTASGLDELGRLRVITLSGEVAVGAGEVTRVERTEIRTTGADAGEVSPRRGSEAR
jgi:BirA family biotin operon repressor/biotin-[acetyl-CoA-carboxylase] ligase